MTLRRARLLELPGWAFYVAGRGGVLGDDARPETVAAAIGVIAPDAVRAGWEAARKVGPAAVAASRLAECARWGDERLTLRSGSDPVGRPRRAGGGGRRRRRPAASSPRLGRCRCPTAEPVPGPRF